jgi:uncharacterized protein YjbI with pentapeptide repeats
MLDLDSVNYLFEERGDQRARGEFAKVLSDAEGWNGDSLYSVLTSRNLLPYWSLIRATNPSLPKISDKSFSGKDLSGTNLSGVSFTSCRFMNTKLVGCDLRNAVFSGCSFTNAFLEDTLWSKARAYKCDLRKARILGANFSGLVYRRCKLPPTLPGHRSHARKGQLPTPGGDIEYPGQIRRFVISSESLRDCFVGIGQSIHYSVDCSGDLAAEAVLVSSADPVKRANFTAERLKHLVPGLIRVILEGDFSTKAARDMMSGLFSGAKIPCRLFLLDTPKEECNPSEGFTYIGNESTP